ncbi:MAG TPA: hypothetical protein VFJ01_07140 [Oleiagrimonas sp.]|nr:hypothetical protein [Oleiagrimonas sp.]
MVSNPPETPKKSTSDRIDERAEKFKEATSKAVDQAHDTLDRTADKVEDGMHRGTDKVADAAEHAAERAAWAAERGRESLDDVMAHAGDWVDKMSDYVREKPTQSVVMAVAAGWLIGRLMRP